MSFDDHLRSVSDSLDAANQRALSRRTLITRSATLGLSIPIVASLLAACADEEDDDEVAVVDDTDDTDDTVDPAAPEDDDEPDPVDEEDDEDEEPVDEPDEVDDDDEEPEDGEPVRGGTITVTTQNDWDGLDPHRQSSGSESLRQIYNCLTYLEPQEDDSIEVSPELATDWELEEEYAIFHLQEGVQFHDGSEWNAEVCAFNIERLGDDQSFAQTFVATITSVDVEDEYTARFNLSAPTGPLLSNMSTSADSRTFMISKQTAEEYGDEYGRSPEATSGTGPMRVVEWVSGSHDIVERTGEYWVDGVDGEPLPYFETQRTEFNADDSVRALALRSGDVDIANNIQGRDLQSIEDTEGIEVVENVFQTAAYQFTFSVEQGPFSDNLDLRKAVHYAINRDALADVLGQGVGEPMRWFLAPGLIGYDESVSYYDYDPDLAREHLDAAGYPDGLEFEMSVINRELDVQQAEMLEQMFAEVGMIVRLDVLERLAWIDKMESTEFEMGTYFTGVRPDPDSLIGARWGCGSGRNYAGLCDDELEELLEAGRSTYDEDEAHEAYVQAQEWMYEHAWYGVMWFRRWFDGYNERVQGRTRAFESSFNLRNAWVTDGQ